ncbi:T9SS type A sorting domain-containing protein [Aureitalea sp. L0-47]|uniref:T9SS type A sorting domain-containing protein n=1 Tax=Aureitalea sp. L0-47 TaxID=2816962 RepID=UPI002237F115|nr:T9SS type A sorting domain-containing protein [Aureitalea sp. L0-47]MCW5519138.1 T9SS type A sorting domain-containing protein [Aureitalea sp. L0-47]
MPRNLLIIPFILLVAIGFTFAQPESAYSANYTSITEQEENPIRVYPNPTNGSVTISGNLRATNLEVYNVLGARVMQLKLSSEQTQLDISDLPSGVYMFRLTSTDGSSVVKKVIKR